MPIRLQPFQQSFNTGDSRVNFGEKLFGFRLGAQEEAPLEKENSFIQDTLGGIQPTE